MGSSPLFWRWNTGDIHVARDGMTPFIREALLPSWSGKKTKQTKEPKRALIVKKLKTIVERKYVEQGEVLSWMEYFDVPKGEDIRLVYNGTSCGLNQALWAPNFWLPFPRSATRLLGFGYYSGDMDLGEMFLNFRLHDTLKAYSGIDLSMFEQDLNLTKGTGKQYRWNRNWMGATSSPYFCVSHYYVVEEFCRGNRLDVNNEMRWDDIVLNLPGDIGYDPTQPRVQKWDATENSIAADLVTFVDDGRATAKTMEKIWRVMHQVCSRCQFFRVQVALREVFEPKLCPGPWAGALIETTKDSVTKSVSQDKWEKGKRLVEELWQQLGQSDWESNPLSYKSLEVTRGFLAGALSEGISPHPGIPPQSEGQGGLEIF